MPQAKADIYTVEEFFTNYALKVPPYQRGFSWGEEEIQVLFQDLFDAFQEIDVVGEMSDPEYFLGAIVTQEDPGQTDFLVDGQQRITCLFLLMCVLSLRCSDPVKTRLLELLQREDQGGFVLQVEGYDRLFREFLAGMVPLARGRKRTKTEEPLALQKLRTAFSILREAADQSFLERDQVDEFASWMLRNVFFARIQDTDPEDSERLFDRINTRGKPLSMADVFRGKVLSAQPAGFFKSFSRSRLNREWNVMRQAALTAINRGPSAQRVSDPLDAEAKLLTAWLIGRYAGRLGSADMATDIKAIRRDPYDWADANLSLSSARGDSDPTLAARRLKDEFFRFVDWIGEVVEAQNRFEPSLAGFRTAKLMRLDFGVALAAAVPARQQSRWRATLPILSRFLDVVAARRGWMTSWRSPASLETLMQEAIVQIREKKQQDLGLALQGLIADAPHFDPRLAPGLSPQTKTWIRYLLSRLDWRLGELVNEQQTAADVFDAKGPKAIEIEHLMGNDFQAFRENFASYAAFQQARDRLGALTLLPKRVNAGLQAQPYTSKLVAYRDQRPLTQSLCVSHYDQQNRFRGLANSEEYGLEPVAAMTPEVIELREIIYACLANDIWNIHGIAALR